MKTKLVASLFVLSMFGQGCVIVTDDANTITIYNESSYDIYELYVTPDYVFDWGPNLLRNDVLTAYGDRITIEVDCDVYDIKVVDDTGLPCELYGVDVCFGEDDAWVIDDFTLDTCAFGVTASGTELKAAHGHEPAADAK